MPTQFDLGLLVGLLVGEGHFGGDGRQAQVTLRMHIRHEAIFRWLERTFPGGRLYGPYHHGGRDYFQWMARGAFLRDHLVPLLDQWLSPDFDGHSFDRFQLMKARYPQLTAVAVAPAESGVPSTSRREVVRHPLARRGAAKRSAASAIRTADHPAPSSDTFADLFKEIREAWPS